MIKFILLLTLSNFTIYNANNVVKVHPKLQEICDTVGSCDKVNIGVTQFGKNKYWIIDAQINSVHVEGIEQIRKDSDYALEGAINDWLRNYNSLIQRKAL